MWDPNPSGSLGKFENWKVAQTLRGHREDVQDLSWAADSTALVTGSVDQTAIVFDIQRGVGATSLMGHGSHVQGVSWDPLGEYFVTQSADRTCRVHKRGPPKAGRGQPRSKPLSTAEKARTAYCQKVLGKFSRLVRQAGGEPSRMEQACLFGDESMSTFFRRLEWSPDGSFLVTTAGLAMNDASKFAAHVYARGSWAQPLCSLPSLARPPVAVRFCPCYFEVGAGGGAGPFSDLPYKFVWAVATLDAVMVYDTVSARPVAVVSGLHYAEITDMAWSWDARTLAISSRDGYCSVVFFGKGELGEIMDPAKLAELKAAAAAKTPPAAAKPAAVPTPSPHGAGPSAKRKIEATPAEAAENKKAKQEGAAPGPPPGEGAGRGAKGPSPQPTLRQSFSNAAEAKKPEAKKRVVLQPLPAGEVPLGVGGFVSKSGPSGRMTTPAATPHATPGGAPRKVESKKPEPCEQQTPLPTVNLLHSFAKVSASKGNAIPSRSVAPTPEPTLEGVLMGGKGKCGAGPKPDDAAGFL